MNRRPTDPSSSSASDDGMDVRAAYRAAADLAGEPTAPAPRVRAAVFAEAHALAAGRRAQNAVVAASTAGKSRDAAANAPRWRIAALGSVLIAGFVGLLSWQVQKEEGDDTARRKPSASMPQTPPANVTSADSAGTAAPQREQAIAARAPAPATAPAEAPSDLKAADQFEDAVKAERPAPARTPAPDKAQPTSQLKSVEKNALLRKAVPAPHTEREQGHLEAAAPTETRSAAAAAPSPQAMDNAAPSEPRPFSGDAAGRFARQGMPAAAAKAKASAPTRDAAAPATSLAAPASAAAFSFHRAAQAGDVTALKAALNNGMAVDAPDASGRTALAWAVAQGHVEAVRMLLAAGADPRRGDRQGVTPLQLARESGSQDIQSLIEAAARR